MTLCDLHKNKIIFKGSFERQVINLLSLKFQIDGKENIVVIDEKTRLEKGKIIIQGNKNRIMVGENNYLRNFTIRTNGIGSKIIVGNNVTLGGGCIHAMEGTIIQIGAGCMLSHDIDIRSGDSHSICNQKTRVKYNNGKDVIIGKHVWIGVRAQILKGVHIADNCVIGASSVVINSMEETNCIIAGYPAKIVKRNIDWER